MTSLFSQPPVAYFQPLEGRPNFDTPCFISCEAPGYNGPFDTEFETISSRVCGWVGELAKNHNLRQKPPDHFSTSEHCTWLFSGQATPFYNAGSGVVSPEIELPSSALIPTAQRQPRVDFVSSAAAMTKIFGAACGDESDVGVMVHRIGDWLVMDDSVETRERLGVDLLPCPSDRCRGGRPTGWDEQRVHSESRWRAAMHHVEVAKENCAAADSQVEEARAKLRELEAKAQEAQRSLGDALSELSEAEAEYHLFSQASRVTGRSSCASTPSATEEQPTSPKSDDSSPRARNKNISEEVEGEVASEDPHGHEEAHVTLYRNFLGHSIRVLQGENAEPEPAGHELATREASAAFGQVGVWKIADDASVVIGSRMLCLGNAEHPKLALYLHDKACPTDMDLLKIWLECLIAGVPEFAICFHDEGAVQSYTLHKISELSHILEDRLQISRKLRMMLEVLRWIKRQCSYEADGCTYWLGKAQGETTLKLFALCEKNAPTLRHREPGPGFGISEDLPITLKNTFLHVLDSAEGLASRPRTQSCPPRLEGLVGAPARRPLRLRACVSALFCQRAISSQPGDSKAVKFFQDALDLEAFVGHDGRLLAQGVRGTGSKRLATRACCHLGLALSELPLLQGNVSGSSNGLIFRSLCLRQCLPTNFRLVPLNTTMRRISLLCLGLAPWPQSIIDTCSSRHTRLLQTLESIRRVTDAFVLLDLPSSDSEMRLSSSQDERPHVNGRYILRDSVESLALRIASFVLLRVVVALFDSLSDPRRLQRLEFLKRLLSLSRLLATFGSEKSERWTEPPLFFAEVPSARDLMVCADLLQGDLLSSERVLRSQTRSEEAAEQSEQSQEPECFDFWVNEINQKVSYLEAWISRQVLDTSTLNAEVMDVSGSLDSKGSPECQAPAFYERGIRLLPERSRKNAVLDWMVRSLVTALLEAAASRATSIDANFAKAPNIEGLNALCEADMLLLRAYDLSDSWGHRATAGLAKSGRGQLRGLMADILVRLAGDSSQEYKSFLSTEDSGTVRWLLRHAEDSKDEETSDTFDSNDQLDREAASVCIGRLGDQSMVMTLEAQEKLKGPAEFEVSTILAAMSASSLQAATWRLGALPPASLPSVQRREASIAMLTRSLHLLSTHWKGQGQQRSEIVAQLCAHAYLLQAELFAEPKDGETGITEKPKSRLHRIQKHLESGRNALQGVQYKGSTGLLLAHLHVAQAQLLPPGTSFKECQRVLEELVAGCGVVAAWAKDNPAQCPVESSESEIKVSNKRGMEAAWAEVSLLLLHQLQALLRDLCTQRAKMPTSVEAPNWYRAFYGAVLRLKPEDITGVPKLYEQLVRDAAK